MSWIERENADDFLTGKTIAPAAPDSFSSLVRAARLPSRQRCRLVPMARARVKRYLDGDRLECVVAGRRAKSRVEGERRRGGLVGFGESRSRLHNGQRR